MFVLWGMIFGRARRQDAWGRESVVWVGSHVLKHFMHRGELVPANDVGIAA